MRSPLFFFLFLLLVTTLSGQDKSTDSQSDLVLQQSSSKYSINALKEYVHAKDDAFEYRIVDKIRGEGHTTFVIRMVSQKWLTTKEVKDPVWWHWLTMVVPDAAKTNTALLFIGGGSRTSKQPDKSDDLVLQLAMGSQSIVAELHNVPNQPTEFVGDDFGPRKEDELIAYGWRQFLEGGAQMKDARWLARFPMTKAAVRAMDVISEVSEQEDNITAVEKYVVAGGSKRGWTTWTTGAVDNRVAAIAPIVIDMLNAVPSFEHHWRVYGYWAPAVGNYVEEGIMEWQNSVEYERLLALTEPFSFKDDLHLPKLIINGTGDQFFLPDSWQFYWKELKGEKNLRYVPNSEHSMRGTDALETLLSFYQMVLLGKQRPTFDWQVKDGVIHLQTKAGAPPQELTLWQAHNPKARNFQVDSIGQAYQPTTIPLSKDGKYTIGVDKPDQGWTAFFVELNFPGVGPVPLKLSTGVVVTPDTYPFEHYKSPTPMGTKIKKD